MKYKNRTGHKRMAIVLLVMVSLLFTGCGSSKENKGQSNQKNKEAKETETTKKTAAEKIEVKDMSKATEEEAWEYEAELEKEIRNKQPKFSGGEYSIIDYGAISSEQELSQEEERQTAIDNTKAIYKAICEANDKGGGTVHVPEGIWYTAAIHLKSNVNLMIEEGAVLKFARDTDLYAGELMKELYGEELTFTRNGGIELYNYSPFIYARGETNVGVTGTGTIDGQADKAVWSGWRTLGEPTAANNLLKQAETDVSVEERVYGESEGEAGTAIDGYIRPNFVEFIDCDGVLLADFTTANSPMWQIHPVYCSNVIIRGLKLNSLLPNNDGIDPDSCKNVIIEENTFNTGDDCIAVKSGKNKDGRRVNIASENIIIQNNVMQEGHGGITLGSEASAGIRNVFAKNNRMESLAEECCLRFKNSTLRGNILENIYYKDTTVTAFKQTRDMIVFESDYGVEDETEYLQSQGIEIKEEKPVTRNVYITGFHASQPENIGKMCENAIRMEGTADSPIQNVYFKDIDILMPGIFLKAEYVDGLMLEQAVITQNRTPDAISNCKNFTFKDVSYQKAYRSSEADYDGIETFKTENFVINNQR